MPLALVPIAEPPAASVYQYIVSPNEIALRFEEEPIQIDEGLALTTEGAEGIPTDTAIGVLVIL
jgi:hypothetical protein